MVGDKMIFQRLGFLLVAYFARYLLPLIALEFREVSIAFHFLLYLGDIERVHKRHGLRVKLCTAHDKNFTIAYAGSNRLFQRVRHDATCDFQFVVARYHHGGAPRQWLADRVEGLAPHD